MRECCTVESGTGSVYVGEAVNIMDFSIVGNSTGKTRIINPLDLGRVGIVSGDVAVAELFGSMEENHPVW